MVSSDERKPGWLLAIPVGAVFLYFISYGPVLSIVARQHRFVPAFYGFYQPIPRPLRLAYAKLWHRIDRNPGLLFTADPIF